MIIIWLILIALVVVASFVLAFRSMRDYQDIPLANLSYTLFLVQDFQQFNEETLKKIYNFLAQSDGIISLERLFRGPDRVFIIFAPSNFGLNFPELNLLELEDYLAEFMENSIRPEDSKKVWVDDTYTWSIAPKTNPKELMVREGFLQNIPLSQGQSFFWQVVAAPSYKKYDFQITVRAMTVDPDSARRVNLVKIIEREITESTGLIRNQKQEPSKNLFKAYQLRSLIPQELSKFVLSAKELLKLLGL